MLVNKTKDMTPFDMVRKPSKQYWFLLPIVWGGSFLMTRQHKLKIEKKNMEGLKTPYLVIATHQGFADYYIGPLALFPHRAMYVSDMEGFAAFGKWLYRGIGCIGKRRYVSDFTVVNNMKYALSIGQSVVVYPESRHSNVGTTAYIPKNMGKLAKMLKVPVVVLSAKGSYLANPFWDEEHTRKAPIRVSMELLYTAEELSKMDASVVQEKIEEKLNYNEYQYQLDEGFLIDGEHIAEGLHKPLYRCVSCKEKYKMVSKGRILECTECGKQWTLLPNGQLQSEADCYAIPEWYEWEREQAEREYREEEKLSKAFAVRVEALPNEKGFVDLGEGTLTMNSEEFRLIFRDVQGNDCALAFPHGIRESVQTEYNYRGKGMCIVLSTKDCCYYLYSDDPTFQPTEIQFLGEYFYQNIAYEVENDLRTH